MCEKCELRKKQEFERQQQIKLQQEFERQQQIKQQEELRKTKEPSLETETLNGILSELSVLNGTLSNLEKAIRSPQPMHAATSPMQQGVQTFNNFFSNMLKDFDLEKGLRALEVISDLYKNVKNDDKTEDKELS